VPTAGGCSLFPTSAHLLLRLKHKVKQAAVPARPGGHFCAPLPMLFASSGAATCITPPASPRLYTLTATPPSQYPPAGSSDLATANRIAREMIFRCGFRCSVCCAVVAFAITAEMCPRRLAFSFSCAVFFASFSSKRLAMYAPLLSSLRHPLGPCSKRLGPVSLMTNEETYLKSAG